MPRLARRHLQRGCFHVLNRGNHRQTLFPRVEDYAQFLELLTGAQKRFVRNAAWEVEVDQPMEAHPLMVLRQSVVRGTPFGAADWVNRMVAEQGLETTVRPRGRPRKSLSVT
jgi:hypothetical protein